MNIPQHPPFVMIDELLYSDDLITRSRFKIKAENVLTFDGEFSEGGLMENIAQTAAAREGYFAQQNNEPIRVGYIGAVKNLAVFHLPKVNDELITEIKIENQVFDVSIISGKVWCNEVLMAECEMKIFLQK